MKRLIVFAGPNGAGKSSLRDIGGDVVDVEIDADRTARLLSPRDPERAQIEAGRASLTLFRESVRRGNSISLETTLTGQTILGRMAQARDSGYQVELRFIALPSVNDHIARVAQRVSKGGLNVPAETIARRYERSLDNLPAAIQISHAGIVIDNSGTDLRRLLETANGTIITRMCTCPCGCRHDFC